MGGWWRIINIRGWDTWDNRTHTHLCLHTHACITIIHILITYPIKAVGNQLLEEDGVLWSAGDYADHIPTLELSCVLQSPAF